jgi:dihydroorotate dehydrogenase (fumarate)
MDLSTTYMGLKLKNPVIISSSRLTGDLETIRQCISYGAGAVVLKSIFEEQMHLRVEARMKQSKENEVYFWYSEAREKVMNLSKEAILEHYLEFVKAAKKLDTTVPIISSIHCKSADIWPRYARKIEDAGADALELNISIFPFNNSMTSLEIEDLYIKILKTVKQEVNIPVAIKLGPFFTNLCTITNRLVDAGVDGLVLFNRYFRPDIDIETLKVVSREHFSSPEEMSLPLRWVALLSGHNIPCDLVASTGIHYDTSLIKQILVGAKAVEICSTLFQNGIPHLAKILEGLESWMKKHNFEQLDDFRGKSLDYQTTDARFERIQYMKRDFEEIF